MKKRILIITRKIYPAQSPRSFRSTELAIELSKQGHDVTIYAVLGTYDYTDFQKKYNIKIKNIGKMKFAIQGSDGNINSSIINRVLKKLFYSLIEFPDIEFVYRIPKILKNENNVDLIITIANPHSIHWGVALFKSRNINNFPKTWIADSGDPFMGNKVNRKLYYFKKIEKWFCEKADFLTIPIENAKDAYYKEFHHKIKIIPQGFNFDEFSMEDSDFKNPILTFIYAGTFHSNRNPSLFLEYLSNLKTKFRFIIYTNNKSILESYSNKLGEKLIIKNYISRKKLLKVMSKADFVVNFENNSPIQSPSKLIDYALLKKPILSVESSHLNTKIINEFFNKNYTNQLVIKNIEQYNIKKVAKSFVDLSF